LKVEFMTAFNTLKKHLSSEVVEMGDIISYWADPFTVPKNRTIMLPDSHSVSNGRLTFTVILWVSIMEKNHETVSQSQMVVMEKIFKAVCGDIPPPIISASVNTADYFDPTPQGPNIGVLRIIAEITVDFLDDCI